MFFEKENLAFHLLDVVEYSSGRIDCFNSGRNYSALSYRRRADAHILHNGKSLHLQTGDVCFVPARTDYRRRASEDEMIIVHLDTVDYTGGIEAFHPRDPDAYAALFEQMLSLWNGKEVGFRYRCAALLYEILALCYRENRREEVTDSKIAASVAYLQASFRRPELSMAEVAARSYISEVYFRRRFRAAFGTSPKDYLIRLRIRHAAGLLATGYYSLKELPRLCGYTDYAHFSVEFKRILGVSPSAYLYNYPGGEK